MRISDWSSDVCSSDLGAVGAFEVAVAQVAGAAGALGHVLAGQFQVHAPKARAGRGVDVERLLDLAADVAEAAGLVGGSRRLGVAVPRVAGPPYRAAVAPHRLERRRPPARGVAGAPAGAQPPPAG